MNPELPGGLRPSVLQERRSLREQVTHALRTALVSGELIPGTVYSAPALAVGFGVSATPVREAMLDLVKEGLVEAVRNKGFRIVGVTGRDLDDLAELSALIEVPVTVELARSAAPEALEPLRPLARAVVGAAEVGDLVACAEADRRFHLEMLALSGNRHLVQTAGELRRRAGLFALAAVVEAGLLLTSAQEHEQLLDLMLDRDLAGTRRLIRAHLGRCGPGRTLALDR